MQRKHIGAIVGVVALALILGGITRGCSSTPPTAGSTTASVTESGSVAAVGEATPSEASSAIPAVTRKPGPKTFVMPDFSDYDETEVESWLDAHNLSVTTTFDYGEAEGSDCAENGDGVVDGQDPVAGTKLANKLSTHLVFDAYCDY